MEYIKEMMVNKFLAYIVLDELREGYNGKSFMQKILNRYIIKEEIMKQYPLDKDFINTNPNLPQRDTKLTLIDSFHTKDEKIALQVYNKLIHILSEIIDGKLNTQGKKILTCLKIIGQNNIKAMYVGVNDDNKMKKLFYNLMKKTKLSNKIKTIKP